MIMGWFVKKDDVLEKPLAKQRAGARLSTVLWMPAKESMHIVVVTKREQGLLRTVHGGQHDLTNKQ